MRKHLAVLTFVVAIGAFAPGAASAGTLDQHQDTGAGQGLQVQSAQTVGQTFRAGVAGTMDRVDLWLSHPGGGSTPTEPLTVQVRNTSGALPGTQVLATQSVPVASVPTPEGFVPVTLTPPVPVKAGTSYSIVLSSATVSPTLYSWGRTATDSYAAGGTFFTVVPPGTNFTAFAGDQAFKTYVTPPTGKRAAALKKCKKVKNRKKRKKCRKKAKKKPV